MPNIINHPRDNKSSKTLDRQGVRDIGLKSPSVIGNWFFVIGVMFEYFQIAVYV